MYQKNVEKSRLSGPLRLSGTIAIMRFYQTHTHTHTRYTLLTTALKAMRRMPDFFPHLYLKTMTKMIK